MPEHRSVAPDPIFREIVHADMDTAKQCKTGGCHQRLAGRVRFDGSPVPLCSEHLAEACNVPKRVVGRANGTGFKPSEGSRR